MGLLDEAIREHLDLKRRRGADPEEIERAEREALGPVRRGPEDHEPLEPAAEDAVAYDHGSNADFEELDEEFEEYDEPARSEAAHERARLHERAPAEPHDDEKDEVVGDEEPFAEEPLDADPSAPGPPAGAAPPPQPAPGSTPPRDKTSEETVEYNVEDALEEDSAGGEDVLEETPEFLQDTPDHDRLWFEQRPPRDFDFNE